MGGFKDRRKTRKYSTTARGMQKHRTSGHSQLTGWVKVECCHDANERARADRIVKLRRRPRMWPTVQDAMKHRREPG